MFPLHVPVVALQWFPSGGTLAALHDTARTLLEAARA